MEVGKNFANIMSYNQNMAKGLEDKLFFVNQIDFKKNNSYLFVDFGCADGVLLNALYEIMEKGGINSYFIGYDISDTMIELAKSKFNGNGENVMFTANWLAVLEKMAAFSNMKKVMILSSVIHEVYSYAEYDNDIDIFWDRVLNSNFDYICVRDMMVSNDIERRTDTDIYHKLNNYCGIGMSLRKYLDEFENIWGRTHRSNKQFIHFLLKYRWRINWDREVHENYFPITVEEFLEKMSKYNLVYFNRFRVPFLENCWKKDFDIEINDYTHIKTIFELKKN